MEKRVALVIGNGAYQSAGTLTNPTNDASDVAAALARIGFDVKLILNGNSERTKAALESFSSAAEASDIAIAFYAGHGIESGGENFLLPVDVQVETDVATKSTAINLRSLSQATAKAKRLGLIVLDACRDNPFRDTIQIPVESVSRAATEPRKVRSVSKGLSAVEPPANVLIAFAAKDGTVASDGGGRNSPFSKALLDNIERPGIEVTFLFRRIRDEVILATKSEQQPYVYGSLSRDPIYLVKPVEGTLLEPEVLPPRSSFFTESDAKKVTEIAVRQRLNMPPFEIHEVNGDVAARYRQFVGIWSSRLGYNGVGRQAMLIITDVSNTGIAKGFYLLGPPKRVSFIQDTANYRPIISQISDNSIRFGGGLGITTLSLVNKRAINGASVLPDGRTAAVTLEPVWTLVDQEKAVSGVSSRAGAEKRTR